MYSYHTSLLRTEMISDPNVNISDTALHSPSYITQICITQQQKKANEQHTTLPAGSSESWRLTRRAVSSCRQHCWRWWLLSCSASLEISCGRLLSWCNRFRCWLGRLFNLWLQSVTVSCRWLRHATPGGCNSTLLLLITEAWRCCQT